MNYDDKVEKLVEDILGVLDLGRSDGGYGPTIYGFDVFKQDQLIQIKNLLDSFCKENL